MVVSCRMGIHSCAVLHKGGRVCGMPNHGAHTCRMLRKAVLAEDVQPAHADSRPPKRARDAEECGGASSAGEAQMTTERGGKRQKLQATAKSIRGHPVGAAASSRAAARATQQRGDGGGPEEADVVVVAVKPAPRGRAASAVTVRTAAKAEQKQEAWPEAAEAWDVVAAKARPAGSRGPSKREGGGEESPVKDEQGARESRSRKRKETEPIRPLPVGDRLEGPVDQVVVKEALEARRLQLKAALTSRWEVTRKAEAEAEAAPAAEGSEARRRGLKAQDAGAPEAPEARGGAERVEATRPGAHWDALFDSLAAGRRHKKGNRFEPEAPTLVAKVCSEPGRGELWLGGIPRTGILADHYENKKLSLQVCCMAKVPGDIVVDAKDGEGSRGCVVPGCILFKFEVSHEVKRMEDWRRISGRVVSSIRSGDNGLVHCMGGVHRAPVGAAMFRAVLHDESFDEARNAIEAVRQVEFNKSLPRIGGLWIEQAIHGPWNHKSHLVPDCWAAGMGRSMIHACRVDGKNLGPLCKWNQRDALSFFKSDKLQADTIEEAKTWGRDFCARCEALLRCSVAAKMYTTPPSRWTGTR